MNVQLKIRRYNPELNKKSWWAEYTLLDVDPSDSVLDVL
jgi:succinate dehydrogenase/fumarate reductase-like Fe-S protein